MVSTIQPFGGVPSVYSCDFREDEFRQPHENFKYRKNAMIPDLRKALIDLIFPPECSFCAETLSSSSQHFLCSRCSSEIMSESTRRFCFACGIFLPNSTELPNCPECKKRQFRFDRVLPLGQYGDELRNVVIRLKNSSQFPLARSIGGLLAEHVYRHTEENVPDLAIPIPKYWLKRMRSGVNSAEMLANEIAGKLDIPCFPKAIKWTRYIRKQSLLSVYDRQRNVRNAISVSKGYNFNETHVLLVDDTMTTGATANEAARVLQKAGAKRITVCVVARALDYQ